MDLLRSIAATLAALLALSACAARVSDPTRDVPRPAAAPAAPAPVTVDPSQIFNDVQGP